MSGMSDPFAGMNQMMMGMGNMGNMGNMSMQQTMGGMGNMQNMSMQNMGGGSSVMSFSSFSSSSTGQDGQPVTIQRQYRTTSGVDQNGVKTSHTQGGTYDSRYGGQMKNKVSTFFSHTHQKSIFHRTHSHTHIHTHMLSDPSWITTAKKDHMSKCTKRIEWGERRNSLIFIILMILHWITLRMIGVPPVTLTVSRAWAPLLP